MPDSHIDQDRRENDYRLVRLESKMDELSAVPPTIAAIQSQIATMQSVITELTEAKLNTLITMRETADIAQNVRNVQARLAVLEKIAYAIGGAFVFLQAIPAVKELLTQ